MFSIGPPPLSEDEGLTVSPLSMKPTSTSTIGSQSFAGDGGGGGRNYNDENTNTNRNNNNNKGDQQPQDQRQEESYNATKIITRRPFEAQEPEISDLSNHLFTNKDGGTNHNDYEEEDPHLAAGRSGRSILRFSGMSKSSSQRSVSNKNSQPPQRGNGPPIRKNRSIRNMINGKSHHSHDSNRSSGKSKGGGMSARYPSSDEFSMLDEDAYENGSEWLSRSFHSNDDDQLHIFNGSADFSLHSGDSISINTYDDLSTDAGMSSTGGSNGGGGGGGGRRGGGNGNGGPNNTKNSNGTRGSSNGQDDKRIMIARREHTIIQYLRYVTYLVLICMGGILSGLLYKVVHDTQRNQFHIEFHELSWTIATTWENDIGHLISSIDTLSVQSTTISSPSISEWIIPPSLYDSFTWPNVTIPNFYIHADTITHQSSSSSSSSSTTTTTTTTTTMEPVIQSISFVPLVSSSNRREYETYVHQRESWIVDGLEWQIMTNSNKEKEGDLLVVGNGRHHRHHRHLQTTLSSSSSLPPPPIFSIQDNQIIPEPTWSSNNDKEELYFPIRQMAPVISSLVNYNLGSNNYTRPTLEQLLQSKSSSSSSDFGTTAASLGPLLIHPDQENDDHDDDDKNDDISILKQLLSTTTTSTTTMTEDDTSLASLPEDGDVIGTLWYPIYESFPKTIEDRQLVGFFFTLISWSQLLSGMVPPPPHQRSDTNGSSDSSVIVVVLENSCHQQVTFQLQHGSGIKFLGIGDRHDSKFNDMGQDYPLSSLLDLTQYTTLHTPLYHEGIDGSDNNNETTTGTTSTSCQEYTLWVYPTTTMEDYYVTKAPQTMAIVVASVFLLTVIVFVLYDRVVERRQQLVYKSAMEARAIVSSLFPAVVRDRLFQTNRDKTKNDKKDKKKNKKKKKSKKNATNDHDNEYDEDDDNNDNENNDMSNNNDDDDDDDGGDETDNDNNDIDNEDMDNIDEEPTSPTLLPRPNVIHDIIPESPMKSPTKSYKPSMTVDGAGLAGFGGVDSFSSPESNRKTVDASGPSSTNNNNNSKTGGSGTQSGKSSKGGMSSLLRSKTPKTPKTPTGLSHPKHRLKNFLSQGSSNNNTGSSSGGGNGRGASSGGGNTNVGSALTDETDDSDEMSLAKPIADLFPHTTVLFADIAGFTAWSSEREPEQVFTLLQTIYHAFDKIAKKRGVFKVETIGDCYVAVTGLPDPQKDHAVRMTKFAKECMTRMTEVTKKLEVSLGPDTADLEMRVGLHSGPVTAGVLQGEKSRFQLFGDTVNMASRMESTGERNRIQISQSTADLLIEGGKSFWVRPREKRVHAKGKGDVQTYWIMARTTGMSALVSHKSNEGDNLVGGTVGGRRAPPRTRSAFTGGPSRGVLRATSDSLAKMATTAKVSRQKSSTGLVQASLGSPVATKKEKNDKDKEKRKQRLVEWQVEVFVKMLKKIMVARVESKSMHGSVMDGESKYNNSVTTFDSLDGSFSESQFSESFAGDDLEWSPLKSPAAVRNNKLADRFEESFSVPRRVDMAGLVPVRQNSQRRGLGMTQDSAAPGMPARQASFRKPKMTRTSSMEKPASISSMSMSSISEHDILQSAPDEVINIPIEQPKIVCDEVAEVIVLPKFSRHSSKALADADSIEINPAVLSQLHLYLSTIAGMYRGNPFHNFEHASHVTMSAMKFLNRISNPENVDYERENKEIASDLHDYTYGITSDPLTQFAILFSALIHDVDHAGVPNGRLAVERPELATTYRNQSIAEQNSVDMAWSLLMEPRFKDLQSCICSNTEERMRFRQLVVNSVMATDIFDKNMKSLRNKRWDKAFHLNVAESAPDFPVDRDEDINMKATIVIEHIIQASDVAHTMQHWHIYTKWNERLFEEMYAAFESGRSDKNPADGWYKGELWFFDNYVIPLAKKLEECNVFGVSSDECLNYARANRNEWSAKGEASVLDMVSRYQKRKFMHELGETVHSHDKNRFAPAIARRSIGGQA